MTRIDPDSGWPVGLPARIGFDVFWPDADEPEGFSALTHDGDGIRLVVMRPDGSVVSSVSLVPNERQFQRSFHGRVVRSDRSFALRWNDLAGLNVRVFDARGRALGPAVFLPLAGDSAAAVMAVTRNGYVLGSRRDSATLQTLLFDTTGTPSTESIGFETSTPVEQVIPYHVDTSALAVASYGDELLFGYPASTGSQPAYFLQPLDAQGRPRGTSLRLELPVWVRMARLLTTPTGVVAVLEAARTEPTDGSYVLRMGVWAAGFRCER